MGKWKVGIVGATGVMGQQLIKMLSDHPWFQITSLMGHKSVGKTYEEATCWLSPEPIPSSVKGLVIENPDPKQVDVDVIFSSIPAHTGKVLELDFASAGFPVISNTSAYRLRKEVPLVIPEVNPDHLHLIEKQRLNHGGFIVTSPNCSTTILSMALKPIYDTYGLESVIVTTMQSVSGAGYPGLSYIEVMDNVIPYIKGEEEKIRSETVKIFGRKEHTGIRDAKFKVWALCNRVPTTYGHLESVYVKTKKDIEINEVTAAFHSFGGLPQELCLPSAPKQPIIVSTLLDRPQVKLDRLAGSPAGMSVVVGRIKQGLISRSLSFTLLGHNTIRGGIGSTVLIAELLNAQGQLIL